jgi:phosphogluconate dehydratase
LGYLIGELLRGGFLHPDTKTIAGVGLHHYTQEPFMDDGKLVWRAGTSVSLNSKIISTLEAPFQETGGLKRLSGSLGTGVMKISAVAPEHRIIEAPARVFHDQDAVKAAFKAGEFTGDVIVVVRFQGPKANGMPELHSLTPMLAILQGRGHKVALVTDGRMSGASGKVPAAIHICPEALDGGPIAYIADGDILRVDAVDGTLDILTSDVLARPIVKADLSTNQHGTGRELFDVFRSAVGPAEAGASVFGV